MFQWLRLQEHEKLLKQCVVFTFVCGLAAHAYGFLNLTISHDSLYEFYTYDGHHKISIGRIWFPTYVELTHGSLALPWMNGVLALCWIALSVFLIVKLFRIHQSLMILAVAGICVINPTVTATVSTYIHDLDADMFALLLAVGAAFLWQRMLQTKKRKFQMLYLTVGATLLSISLGIYQSYISVTITLILLLSMLNLLQGKCARDVVLEGLPAVLMLALGAALYIGELKVITALSEVGLKSGSYNSVTNAAEIFQGSLTERIADTYGQWRDAFWHMGAAFSVSTLKDMHSLLAAAVLVVIVYGMCRIGWMEKILFLVLVMVMPLGMNASYFLSPSVSHDVMRYAFWLVYLGALLLLRWFWKEGPCGENPKKGLCALIGLCVGVFLCSGILTANALYVKKDLERQATLSRMTRVSAMMEHQEGYQAGETPVVILGEQAGFEKIIPGFENYSRIVGSEFPSVITYHNTFEFYFKFVLNTPFKLAYAKEPYSKEVEEMPVYPAQGSVRMVDGVLYIKLKE